MNLKPLPFLAGAALFFGHGALAQTMTGSMSQVTAHMGQMSVEIADAAPISEPTRNTLQFEPWQMAEDLFRNDVVFLMRHGPTDWSRRDVRDVAPTDCANQRLLSAEGIKGMQELGILYAGNNLRPSRIIVSEWCRNQQTIDAIIDGFALVDPEYAKNVTVITDPSVNLLLSLRGAPNVSRLREMVSQWRGDDDTEGPLLIISHFTNIAELTEFNVYEGEALVIDPTLSSRVLGYVRLRDARPDVGHFSVD
ncbi:histidine phosphatase family protein [Nereida sp. MMG025]|uniref:histidine phosphatase family protein n=1 Tax=Nereida sp. MMG025 TaxID=2909981 RepID=UPI001F433BED|nr:histidine phosphatase family protein [Nereida sp. MMG025]MCF6446033.1 histidine phosphatase family protein [Nereida sp. MMG025]